MSSSSLKIVTSGLHRSHEVFCGITSLQNWIQIQRILACSHRVALAHGLLLHCLRFPLTIDLWEIIVKALIHKPYRLDRTQSQIQYQARETYISRQKARLHTNADCKQVHGLTLYRRLQSYQGAVGLVVSACPLSPYITLCIVFYYPVTLE